MNFSGKNILFSLVILFALFFAINSCQKNKDLISLQSEKFELLKAGAEMTQKINGQGQVIAVQKAQYFDEKTKSEGLIRRITSLENTLSNVTVVTNTVIDSVEIPYYKTDTIYAENGWILKHYFSKESDYFRIKGFATPSLVYLDSIVLPNSLSITHKWQRKNFLAKKEYIIEAVNSNPYVVATSMNNYTFVEEKKWYEKRGIAFVTGVFVGIAINRK